MKKDKPAGEIFGIKCADNSIKKMLSSKELKCVTIHQWTAPKDAPFHEASPDNISPQQKNAELEALLHESNTTTFHKSLNVLAVTSEKLTRNQNNIFARILDHSQYKTKIAFLKKKITYVYYKHCYHQNYNSIEVVKRRQFLLRLATVTVVLTTLFLINIVFRKDLYSVNDVTFIYDFLHHKTRGLNQWISKNPAAYSTLIIIASACMDILFISLWMNWLFLGNSFRFILTQVLFYVVRGALRWVCVFPAPKNYVWGVPTIKGIPIPSLTVPYQRSDDFFFSGHIGFGTIAFLESKSSQNILFQIFSIFVTLYQFFIFLVTRGHYTIDMITGVLVAYICFSFTDYIVKPQ